MGHVVFSSLEDPRKHVPQGALLGMASGARCETQFLVQGLGFRV